jgi:exonuclease III
MLFLQEVKIANTDTKTQEAVRKAVNARILSEGDSPGLLYDTYFTLPTDRKNARGLGGTGKVHGVCSIVRSDLSESFNLKAEHRTVNWDKEGRVSIVELSSLPPVSSSTPPIRLSIFNIYAVNGTDSRYRDPRTGAVIGTRHDRKLEFHRLLMEECISMEKEGWDIVMAGDFNIAPARIDGYPNLRTFPHQHGLNRADFLAKFLGQEKTRAGGEEEHEDSGWRGVDVWREMNPDIRRFTYFSRNREWGSNCDRVDYVIVGRKIWDAARISAAGILDNEVERGPSDHVPIWVDIALKGTQTDEQDKTQGSSVVKQGDSVSRKADLPSQVAGSS